MNSIYLYFKNHTLLKDNFSVTNDYELSKYQKKNCLSVPPILPSRNNQTYQMQLRVKPDYDCLDFDNLVNAINGLASNGKFYDSVLNKYYNIHFNWDGDFIFNTFDDSKNAIYLIPFSVQIEIEGEHELPV